jgi:alginate O-acetyltransferase complex protein AlgI
MRNYQLYILILSGFIFYGFNHLPFLVLLISSALLNSTISYLVFTKNDLWVKKIYAILGIILNISLLSLFKYGSLIYKTFFTFNNLGEFLLTLPLPIGISFYTFQGISLLVDVFKDNENLASLHNHHNYSFVRYILHIVFFISFFPHSIAGPIVKAHTFLPQIKPKYFNNLNLIYIYKILLLGYFFKNVIADNLHNFTFWIAYPYFQVQSTITLITMLFGYSCQIFADFAGYSLIAIGIAALFGYELPPNFNYPYISQTFSEFWKRWHMSLSSWLKDYLYIPLGGNKKGIVRTCINLLIVMLLGGLWHGAAWSYLIWGGVHGIMLLLERILLKSINFTNRNFKLMRIMMIFCFVSWAWLLFKLPDFNHVILYSKSIVSNLSLPNSLSIIFFTFLYSLPILLYHFLYLYKEKFLRFKIKYESIIYAVILFLILMNSGGSNAFIYFQF